MALTALTDSLAHKRKALPMSLRDKMRNLDSKTEGTYSDHPQGSTPSLSTKTDNVTIFPQLVTRLANQFSDGKVPKWLNAVITHNMKDAADENVAPVLAQVIETMREILDEYSERQGLVLAHELEQGEAEAALTAEAE